MMLTAMAILIGATLVWRGRVAEAANAAALRRAALAINRQVLILAVTFLAAIMPAVRVASDLWLVTALASSGIFSLILFAMRARWQNRATASWESSVQASMRRTLLPAPAVHVMPSVPERLREAA
jgi:hypothetical protein